jgi:LmbE family N-acetylglucosaminyl deacetylase
MNPYLQFVSEFTQFIGKGKTQSLGGITPDARTVTAVDAPIALIFSPHPDDECIIGALALRLLREARVKVVNVAVTLGSKKERRAERLAEVEDACRYLGFDLIKTRPNGLENINVKGREQEPALWNESVQLIMRILKEQQPQVIFFPHEFDWNSTHIGTHFLVLDALNNLGSNFETFIVETEFWGQMQTPNLMVESSPADVADMVAGISFHIGEVQRNPYHLFLPSWMHDNVRRGTEIVGGQGTAAPDFVFATLYRVRRWCNGRPEAAHERGKVLPATQNPASVVGGENKKRPDWIA